MNEANIALLDFVAKMAYPISSQKPTWPYVLSGIDDDVGPSCDIRGEIEHGFFVGKVEWN
ncbi:hypothetical protein TM239_02170 [Bradyrhizobium sp. TM239]|nr:hypothetical protein TM239_02170 [Bradyrhizobium sp. TM239]